MNEKSASILLAAVIIARATSYYFIKIGMQGLDVFNLLSVRFAIATILLTALFFKKLHPMTQSTFTHGTILGVAFFAVMAFEFLALKTAAASTVAFLENTSIVIVPILIAITTRSLPTKSALVGIAVTILGVGFLTYNPGGFSLSQGEIYALLAALSYAVVILLTARYASGRDDSFQLGYLQVFWIFIFSTAATFLLETPQMPQSQTEWTAILALAVVCTGFGFTLQPVAQQHTTTERAGMFCALNPLCATIMGTTLLGETLSVYKLLGITCIIIGLTLPIILDSREKKKQIQ